MMWRRNIFTLASIRNAVARKVAEESEKKDGKYSFWKKAIHANTVIEKVISIEFFKYVFAFIAFEAVIEKEMARKYREEHIILFGKHGYGVGLMRMILLGTAQNAVHQVNDNGNNYEVTGKDDSGMKVPENKSPSKLREVEGFNKDCSRNVKITFLNAEMKDYLSSLSISEEYSVVYCFPVSFRVTTEDVNLLENYLQYRQRENHEKVTIAFTYSERLEGDAKLYIDNLPKKFKDILKKYKNNYMFISSRENEHKGNAERLLKPIPGKEFIRECRYMLALFLGLLFVL